jgi:A/G-specific adenine glycosylase
MDLGATLCTRTKPRCSACPVNTGCQAYSNKEVHLLPTPKLRKAIPEKSTTMLVFINGDEVMLEKRAPIGIWGGLWSFPEVNNNDANLENASPLAKLTHTFTHFKLHIQPQLVHTSKKSHVNEPHTIWLSLDDAISAAIPTPIRKILIALKSY